MAIEIVQSFQGLRPEMPKKPGFYVMLYKGLFLICIHLYFLLYIKKNWYYWLYWLKWLILLPFFLSQPQLPWLFRLFLRTKHETVAILTPSPHMKVPDPMSQF